MARPGVTVTSGAASPARGEPTDTGKWFVPGFTEWGPVGEAVTVTSLTQFREEFGDRLAHSVLHDALELAFAEGLAEAVISRVVGPAPVKATVTFQTAGAVDTMAVDAVDYGDYANGANDGYEAEVVEGSEAGLFTLNIYFDGDLVEAFEDAATVAEIVALSENSDHVRVRSLGAGADPEPTAATNLAGGTDDHSSATDANWETALDVFAKDLGPGQVSLPGRTTSQAHTDLIQHASTRNRNALLDTVDKASKATLLTAVDGVADLDGAEYAAIFGSWLDIGPLAAGGASRAVPGSAYAAGVIARTDALEGNAGSAAAGEVSTAGYAKAVRKPDTGFTESDYEDLNDAGVNMVQEFRNRGIQLYGFRSVSSDPEWVQFSYNRERVSLEARLNAISLRYNFKKIDGRGQLLAKYNGELVGECLSDYKAGVLYGAEPGEAFRVDTGPAINTEELKAGGEIAAQVSARFSPFAEHVQLNILKVPITSQV